MEENGVRLQEKENETLEADRARALAEKQARREAAARIKRRKIRRKRIISLIIAVLVIGGIAFGMYSLFHEEEPELTVWR